MTFKNTSKGDLCFTLANPEQEVFIAPDAEAELPEDNAYIKTLVGLGHLTPVAKPAAKSNPETPKP